MATLLQSCFESQPIETTTLNLKFSPPDNISGPSSFQKILSNICSSSNPKETTMEKEEDSVYVHPLSRKSSFSKLSEKSFEMCTENLGSETGSDDIIDSTIFSNSPIREISSFSPKNKVKSSRDFPPPLTSISGGGGRNSIQVRPHRENGRLVIRAVETLAARTYLRSERGNGRLRLSILKNDDDVKFEESESEDDKIDLVEKNDENYINDEDLEEGDVDDQELGRGPTVSAPHFVGQLIQVEDGKVSFKDMSLNEIDNRELSPRPTISSLLFASRLIQVEDYKDGFGGMDQNGVDEIENEEEDMDMDMDMDMDGNNFEIEVEMGMEKFHKKLTRRRCNQVGHSNKELYNWELLWVATSQVEVLFWISLQYPKNTTIFSVYLC